MYPTEITNRLQVPQQYFYPSYKLAHAYVPFQCLMFIYTPMEGLGRGTIFPELDSPYGAEPEYTVDA